jgi:hypothetical protein
MCTLETNVPTQDSKEERMTTATEYEQLAERYRRLRVVCERLVEAADYPAGDDDESRVYRSQLRAVERELRGTPQPSKLMTMGN